MGTVHWGVDWGWKSWEINTDSMKMTPKERILCALNLEEPDRVPYCEATIDPVVAAKLLGREPPRELVEVGTVRRPVEEDKALSQLLHRDNITCRLTAPIFAEKLRGKDGRIFFGKGLIKSEKDLELMDFPDPNDDSLYAEAEEYVRKKDEFALIFSTRLGISPTYLSMGMEEFFYALCENPQLVEKIMDAYCQWTTAVVERICQLDFDIIWFADDLAWKKAPLFSPKFFHDIAVPKIRGVVGGNGYQRPEEEVWR
jgi:hypothetical protein